MLSYAAVVFVSMLAVVSGQCTKTYSGLTQCTILNGATTTETGMMSIIGSYLHTARPLTHPMTTVFVERKHINVHAHL
jgi:hypothetical protein